MKMDLLPRSCNDQSSIISATAYAVLFSEEEVLACSDIKIPFEPKGEQREFRELLRGKLRALEPKENHVFCAKYGSLSGSVSDIENALFYNIGTASFSNPVKRETPVYFQRIQPNEVSGYGDRAYQAVYQYSFEPKEDQEYWWEHEKICEWNQIPLTKVNSSSKAADYFLAIRTHPESVQCFREEHERALGLRIQVWIPQRARFQNVVTVMKPMIDGVICAFHSPDGVDVDEVSKRLFLNREVVSATEKTCLGKHCFIRPYRNSVMWAPQDDRLDFVVIEPVFVDGDCFSFCGALYAVPQYM